MTKHLGECFVWMAAVLGLGSCTSADNIAQITPGATLGAASSAPASSSAESVASTAPASSSAESAASSAPSATEPAESSAPSSTEPAASTAPGTTASATVPADLCPEAPAPLNAGEASLEFTTELRLGGVPLVYGEPNALEGGGTLLPLNFRFYISEVALVRADATEVRADIVTETGAPVPYGVQFVMAEEPSSMRFRLLVPPGTYSGASFLLGVSDACDSGFPGDGPFAASTGMTWEHGFGYLFLRYEGTVADAEEGPPGAIHMGGLQGILLAPRVQAPGEFNVVENAAANVRLVFDVDELFEGATSSLDVSDTSGLLPPLPEVALGERARRLAPELSLFTLEPQ